MHSRPHVPHTTSDRKHSRNVPGADRQGQVLAFFAILLPVLLVITGLVLDGGALLNEYRISQHAVDAAATAAARSLHDGATEGEAISVAEEYVREHNNLNGAAVTVSIPPATGPLAGDKQSVEVEVIQPARTHFLGFVGDAADLEVRTRAVARYEPSTAGAALVVLDPDPAPLSVPALGFLPVLPALPSLIGGLEVIGTSQVRVDGAIHVNTTWGGFDEDGNPAGESAAPPSAIATLGLPINEKLQARDIRVVGGVDNRSHYGHFVAGEPSPLQANRLPVPDPLIDVPVPTVISDSVNVSTAQWGGVRIANLIGPPQTLQPGVYDFIQIVSGDVRFDPGVYIIRSVDPLTRIGLNIIGGRVRADGVMFYITNSGAYTPGSGAPDDADGETVPPAPGVATLLPSAVVAVVLPGSRYSGLDDPGSPFDGMLIFQRRTDRRPVVIVNNLLLGGADVDGTIYAKWGHVILSGSGFRETRVVAGTLRLISVTSSLIAPTNLLPPAEDVFLVE